MRVRARGSRSEARERDRSSGAQTGDRSPGAETGARVEDPPGLPEEPLAPGVGPISPEPPTAPTPPEPTIATTPPAASPDATLRDALRPSGPARFAMTAEHRPGVVVVHVDGELDLLTAPKLGARLNGVIRGGMTDLVLDLRDVQFMDSAGLQLLLTTRRRLLRDSRELSVICVDGPVRRVIEMARLTEALRVTTG